MKMKQICNLLLVVLMLSLVVVAGGCGSKFQLTALEVSPEVCLSGDTVTILATLDFTGDVKSDYVAELLVDGAVEQTQTFTFEPQSSQSLSFTLTKGEPGSYAVQLGNLKSSFTVLGASNIKVSPDEVEVDQPVTVTADLQNVTETEVTYRCCLLCQGEEVEAKNITLAASSMDEVAFTLSQATSGMYSVELLGLSGSFKVLKPAEFVVFDFEVAPNPVKVGGMTEITAGIENVGEVEGTGEVSLIVDGMVEETKEVTLAAGAATTELFTLSKGAAGNYSLQIGAQQAELRVVQPVRLPTGTILLNELSSGKSDLKIFNERDLDVVVVLSSPEEPEIPLWAIYVRSGDYYTFGRIAKGTYILYFTFGEEQLPYLAPVALFDVLVNNADRKGGHLLLDEWDRIWAIDNALTFHSEPKLRTVIWDFAGAEIPEEYLADLRQLQAHLASKSELRQHLSDLLFEDEIAALQIRLARLLEDTIFPHPDPDRRQVPWPMV